MSRRENPIEAAFWPGTAALRWWTVSNHAGDREVVRVDTEVPGFGSKPVRLLVYLVMQPGAFAHPPLAAALLRLGASGFRALESQGVTLVFCLHPETGFTERGVKYEQLFCPESALAGMRAGDIPWTYEEPDA